jgi:hypothetical protein
MKISPKIHGAENWAICITACCRNCDNRETTGGKETELTELRQGLEFLEFHFFFKTAIGL